MLKKILVSLQNMTYVNNITNIYNMTYVSNITNIFNVTNQYNITKIKNHLMHTSAYFFHLISSWISIFLLVIAVAIILVIEVARFKTVSKGIYYF